MAQVIFRGAKGTKFNWNEFSFEPGIPVDLSNEECEGLKDFILSEGRSPSKNKFLELLDWTDELREALGKKSFKRKKKEEKSEEEAEVKTDE